MVENYSPNILTITRSAWNNNNSIGNTLSSLFKNYQNKKGLSNINCRSGAPLNNICDNYYSITEKQIVKNFLFGSKVKASSENQTNKIIKNGTPKEEKWYDFFRGNRWIIFLWLQELIWYFGHWKTNELDVFLKDNKPEIIFFPVFQSIYAHRILWYCKRKTNAKIVLFHADDYLTFKQFSLSPLFWINRIICRYAIFKSIKISDLNYCISELQQKEYKLKYKFDSKILYKFDDFTQVAEDNNSELNNPIQFVYTGNLYHNRWKVLASIVENLKELNNESKKAVLIIYSGSKISKKIYERLNDEYNVYYKGAISFEKVVEIQNKADVLVHVESFSMSQKLAVRLSFSTKLVDYLKAGKCIYAVGPKEIASMQYLHKHNAAIISNNKNEIYNALKNIANNNSLIQDFANKAQNCGRRNHDSRIVQTDFYKTLCLLLID